MTQSPHNEHSGDTAKPAAEENAGEIFLPGDLIKSMPEEVLARQKRVGLALVSDNTDDEEKDAEALQKSREEQARHRQMAYLHKRRKQKKRQVFYSRIRQVLKLCFGVFWLVVIWQLVSLNFWILDEPRLVLLNQQLISPEHIQPLINPLAGKPVFGIRPDDIAAHLKEKFPLIDEIYVRRYLFPARVELFVLEKQPWAELYAVTDFQHVHVPADADKPSPASSTPNPQAPRLQSTEPYGLLTTDYDIVSLARYRGHYHKDRYTQNSIHKIIVPNHSFKPNKTFLKRLDKLAYKLSHADGLHFESLIVESPDMIRARYKETDVIIGRLDKGVYRRVDRLNGLIPKILEIQNELTAVDLRWSEQITFKKK